MDQRFFFDGVVDGTDIANAGQRDMDGDGSGNAYDTDDDYDGIVDGTDNCPLLAHPTP